MANALMNIPPPQWPPRDTDCTFVPSISTHEFSYPNQRHVFEAPIGSMISSRSTSGSGRRQTCSAASAITFTRTSLYLKCVPGSYIGRFFHSDGLPTGLLPQSGLPHRVPYQSPHLRSSFSHVIAWLL